MTQPNTLPAVTLISHASVIIELGDAVILTDPWQFGTAFNDSWKLIIEPADLTPHLDRITHIWISHEHPDHFHIPTLKALPEAFRRRVTVLFQQSSDSGKMVSALTKMIGFAGVRLLPHRKWEHLTEATEIYCFHSRQIDSALAVRANGCTVLNLNDCEASEGDLEKLRKDIGAVDLLMNQFSIAGFDGNEDLLSEQATGIINTMARDHRALSAKSTLPFASFVYFCCPDNMKINIYANSPNIVANRFEKEGLDISVLVPGERMVVGSTHDNDASLVQYESIYTNLDRLPITSPISIPVSELREAFFSQRIKLAKMHGMLALRMLKPVRVAIPDLQQTVVMSFRDNDFSESDQPPDIEIASQPLHFMLSNSFGLQTLGVSGRYRLFGDLGNWFRHRALFAMMNAGIGLSFSRVFSSSQLAFFWRRRSDIFEQLRYRVSRTFDPARQSK